MSPQESMHRPIQTASSEKVKANREDPACRLLLSRDRVSQIADLAAALRIEFGPRRCQDWIDR